MHTKAVHDKIRDQKCNQHQYSAAVKAYLGEYEKIVHAQIKDQKCDERADSFSKKYFFSHTQESCSW